MTTRSFGAATAALGLLLVVAGVGLSIGVGDSAGPAAAATGSPGPSSSEAPSASPAPSVVASPTTVTPGPTVAPSPTPTTPSDAASEADRLAITAFLARFVEGIRTGDVDGLFVRLHRATIDRYGEAACRAQLVATADPTFDVVVRDIGPAAPWAYETDGLTTAIPEAWPVDADLTIRGATSRVTLHLAAAAGGVIQWFTDCGTPVAGHPSPLP